MRRPRLEEPCRRVRPRQDAWGGNDIKSETWTRGGSSVGQLRTCAPCRIDRRTAGEPVRAVYIVPESNRRMLPKPTETGLISRKGHGHHGAGGTGMPLGEAGQDGCEAADTSFPASQAGRRQSSSRVLHGRQQAVQPSGT